MTFLNMQPNVWHLEKFIPQGTLIIIVIILGFSVLSVAIHAVRRISCNSAQ